MKRDTNSIFLLLLQVLIEVSQFFLGGDTVLTLIFLIGEWGGVVVSSDEDDEAISFCVMAQSSAKSLLDLLAGRLVLPRPLRGGCGGDVSWVDYRTCTRMKHRIATMLT